MKMHTNNKLYETNNTKEVFKFLPNVENAEFQGASILLNLISQKPTDYWYSRKDYFEYGEHKLLNKIINIKNLY